MKYRQRLKQTTFFKSAFWNKLTLNTVAQITSIFWLCNIALFVLNWYKKKNNKIINKSQLAIQVSLNEQ